MTSKPMSETLEKGQPITEEMIEEMGRLENCERALAKFFDYGFECDSNFAIKLNRVNRWRPGMTQEERESIGL